jgi:hypothetical protein
MSGEVVTRDHARRNRIIAIAAIDLIRKELEAKESSQARQSA